MDPNDEDGPPIPTHKHDLSPSVFTPESLLHRLERGILAVEMEAAALYAFAQARGRNVLRFAHVANQMGRLEGDVEKGHADGASDALAVVLRVARQIPS